MSTRGFPHGLVVKNLPASAGDTGSIPDQGRSHMRGITKIMCSALGSFVILGDLLNFPCASLSSSLKELLLFSH